jgi:hypothetical protein
VSREVEPLEDRVQVVEELASETEPDGESGVEAARLIWCLSTSHEKRTTTFISVAFF